MNNWRLVSGGSNVGFWKTVSAVALGVFNGGIFVLPAAIWLVDVMLRAS